MLSGVPIERRVLMALAVLRDVTTAGVGVAIAWIWSPACGDWSWALIAVPLTAVLWGIFWADFPEHWLRGWLLGYVHNPRVSATAGEWEKSNIPTRPELIALWQEHKFAVLYYRDRDGIYRQAVWEGDPGTGRFGSERM